MRKPTHTDEIIDQLIKEITKEYGYLDIKELWKRFNNNNPQTND